MKVDLPVLSKRPPPKLNLEIPYVQVFLSHLTPTEVTLPDLSSSPVTVHIGFL